jgi:MinD superfamily P-loop ATPase
MSDVKTGLREIVVISGKGGTGKTSLVASFAALAQNTVFCDMDVDVPDLHIILRPKPRQSSLFMGGNKAAIRVTDCIRCGTCMKLCHFGAIQKEGDVFHVDPVLCEGCGVCVSLCPRQAIAFPEVRCGEWHVSETRFGPMVHASLIPGQENSGRLVSILKREARRLAENDGYTTILCDGSPGIGCPVVSSLAGASLAVAVIEPSLSGLHDFERIAGLCRHFRIPLGIVINRWDLVPEEADRIERSCREAGYTIFGRVPFDADMQRATALGLAATEMDTPLGRSIRDVWNNISSYHPSPSATLRSYAAQATP